MKSEDNKISEISAPSGKTKLCIGCNGKSKYIGLIQKKEDEIYFCNECLQSEKLSMLLNEKGLITSEEESGKLLIACPFQEAGCTAHLPVKDLFSHQDQCKDKENAKDQNIPPEKLNIEIPQETNSKIPLEDPLKTQIIPNEVINEIKDQKDFEKLNIEIPQETNSKIPLEDPLKSQIIPNEVINEIKDQKDFEKLNMEIPQETNSKIPLEDPLKRQIIPNEVINEIKDQKDVNQDQKIELNVQGITSEASKVEKIETSNVNELNRVPPSCEQDKVETMHPKKEMKDIQDMKDNIEYLLNTVKSLQGREKNLIISKNQEINELKKIINDLQNSDKKKQEEIDQLKSSFNDIGSKYISEKNDFEQRIEYVLPNYEILLFQFHQLIEEEYQTYFDTQIQKQLDQFKSPIIKQIENITSKLEINETQIKDLQKTIETNLNVASTKGIPQNIQPQFDINNTEILFKEFKQYLSKDITNEASESDFKNDLTFFIMQLISRSEKNILGNSELKLSNIENIQKEDYIKIKKFENDFKEIIEKISNMKIEYSDLNSKLATQVGKNSEDFTERINQINLNNFKNLKIFDEQFEQIYKEIGNTYSKIINLENFQIEVKKKDLEIKTINIFSSEQLKGSNNKELNKLNSSFLNLESQYKSLSGNVDKNEKEFNKKLKDIQESITTKFKQTNNSLTGKLDSTIFNTKNDEYVSKHIEIDNSIKILNDQIKKVEDSANKSNLKFNSVEKAVLKKEEINNLISQKMDTLGKNYYEITCNLVKSVYDNFCITCGRLIGSGSKIGYKLNETGAILCIKCNAKCVLCGKLVLSKNEAACCSSCERILCSNCKKEKKIIEVFPKCSFCNKKNNCIKCLLFNGQIYCCNNCLPEMTLKANPELIYLKIIVDKKEDWDFSNVVLEEENFQKILFFLKNSSTVSTITFMKSSLLKSDQNFRDFINSIRNHKSLKTCTIDISNLIPVRSIFKLILDNLNKIISLETLTIRVANFKEKDLETFKRFLTDCEIQWSRLHLYFSFKYSFESAQKNILWTTSESSLYLNFVNKKKE